MKYLRTFCTVLACGFLTAAPQAQIVSEIPVGPVYSQMIYRVAICPDGTIALHNGAGELTVVDSAGGLVRREGSFVADATASTCDGQNRLIVAAKGYLHVFRFGPSGGVALEKKFYVSGIGLRLLTVGETLYVLGFARVQGQPALIRRYHLPDGRLLGTINTDLPLLSGGAVNRYLPEGSLLPVDNGFAYVPANPFEFHVFNQDGSLRNIVQPSLPHFRPTNVPPPRQPVNVDWIVNAVPLPGGRVATQVVRRGEGPESGSEVPYSYLILFDSSLRLTAGAIRVGEERFPGLLAGSDAAGNLYFAKLSVPDGGRIFRVRLP